MATTMIRVNGLYIIVILIDLPFSCGCRNMLASRLGSQARVTRKSRFCLLFGFSDF